MSQADKPRRPRGDHYRQEESVPSLREPRYSQSLERGLAILALFTADNPVRGIADIADELGMSRSTTHRYLVTLVELGYVEQDSRRKYRLALKVIDLGQSAMGAMSLKQHAGAMMKQTAEQLGCRVNLAVLNGIEVICLESVGSRLHRIGRLAPATPLPLHSTSEGKLLLANLLDAEQRRLTSQLTLTKHGPNTITTKKALRENLEQIRFTGLAIDDQESAEDVSAIAAAVRSDDGEVEAAVSAVLPQAMHVDKLVMEISPSLQVLAQRISARLGYRRPDESSSRQLAGAL
jgi:IclR family pca regulon transcriptional regulator